MINLDKLEAMAKAATPGPWFYQDESDAYTHIVRPVDNPGRIIASGTQTSDARGETTGRFIAAANPSTVLELIALVRRQHEALDGAVETNNSYLREIDQLKAAAAVVSIPVIKEGARIDGGSPAPASGLLEGWRESLRKELEIQNQHYGEVAACAAAGSRLHAGERDCTEGVIKGIEYCIERLESLSATAPVADTAPTPAGWKLVPIEPTDDMEVAFAEAWFSKARPIDDCQMADAYRDMLAAAPAPGAAS